MAISESGDFLVARLPPTDRDLVAPLESREKV